MLTWIIFGLDFYSYYFVNMVALSYNVALTSVLSVFYGVIILGVLYYAVQATRIDPTDPTIYAERKAHLEE
jgi:hypothetical protein